jgi:hypothetical protein
VGRCGPLFKVFRFLPRPSGNSIRTEEKAALPEIKLDKDEITKRLDAGRPVIGYEDITFDRELANNTFRRIAQLMAEYPEILGPVPESCLRLTLRCNLNGYRPV